MSLRNFHAARIDIPSEMKVELNDVEDRICELFDDCSKYLRKEKGTATTCRIAGGWVRDKVNRWFSMFFLPLPIVICSLVVARVRKQRYRHCA
jgi:hypothetical protein